MAITKYNNLSNRELLNQLYVTRNYSPIIEELCQRVEAVGAECPVCEADLQLAKFELET